MTIMKNAGFLKLPTFRAIHDVRADTESRTVAITFESDNHEYFRVVFSSGVVASMIPALLEKTPPDPSFATSKSFVAPVKKFRSGILEGGEPTLGIFFPSGVPVSLLLDSQTISSMIFALKELQSIIGGTGQDTPTH